jgi:hypothetical protein
MLRATARWWAGSTGRWARSEVSTVKIRVKLGMAATLVLIAAAGVGLKAWAQDPVNDVPAGAPGLGLYYHMNKGGFQETIQKQSGQWAEVITATPKWIVVQDEDGKQYPIASDRVRQFLIRWPSSPALLTNASLVEVTGPDAGSNVIIADHIDQYEDGAQSLVSPTVNNHYNNYGFNYNYGYSQTLSPWNVAPLGTFQSTYYGVPFGYAPPLPMHIVGRALGNDPVRIAGNGDNWYTLQPGSNGMSVTQVTVGNNSYAKRGDAVYLILDNISPRSLDVSQLILYKKIPLRAFQP